MDNTRNPHAKRMSLKEAYDEADRHEGRGRRGTRERERRGGENTWRQEGREKVKKEEDRVKTEAE